MASGVNVKMGVSGVAQFKQSINQAKQSVKTLDAQIALSEKQFKANGDAEEYLQKKTEQLQSKMEAQKTVNDSISSFIKEYNKKYGYDAILLKGATLYIDPRLDITDDVIKGLNARYNKVKK